MTVNQKILQLRNILEKKGLSALIINSKDSHDSEYTADYWHELEFITGFTGGEGVAVISSDEALIWVDSRYFIQCKQEIKDTCFTMKEIDGPHAESPVDYIKNKYAGKKIGINAQTLMVSELRKFKLAGIEICPCEDLLSDIWTDRPALPETKVREFPIEYSEETCDEKIARIRAEMKKDCADYTLISSLDDIAWILNLRASDLQYVPVFYSYLIIGHEKVVLYTSKKRFQSFNTTGLCYEIKEYDDVFEDLEKLDGTAVINPDRINVKIFSSLKQMKIIEKREYSTDFKAIKNKSETAGFDACQVLDSISLLQLFYYIKSTNEQLTELKIAEKLERIKHAHASYQGPSFATICAFAENGAIVHYSTDEKHNRVIDKDGLLVLDCGSQYDMGTTDVTRTILIGNATQEQKEHYTAVLKAHLKLHFTVFPKGTVGMQLDSLARSEVWKVNQNYFHGTGHGVGCNLSVHEGPQRISSKGSNVELKVGMMITDEPGIYIEGKYGIRIENIMRVEKQKTDTTGSFLFLSPQTYVPYERDLILKEKLTEDEIKYIDDYHKNIYNKFVSVLPEGMRKFLKDITRPL